MFGYVEVVIIGLGVFLASPLIWYPVITWAENTRRISAVKRNIERRQEKMFDKIIKDIVEGSING